MISCPKCNSEKVVLTPKGTATQASCGECGHFIKWASKDDIRLIQTKPPTLTTSPSLGGYVVVGQTNDPIPGIVNCPSVQILPQEPKTNGDKIRASSDEQLATAYADAIKCDQCLIVYDCMEIRRSKKCICKLIAWLQSPAEVQL